MFNYRYKSFFNSLRIVQMNHRRLAGTEILPTPKHADVVTLTVVPKQFLYMLCLFLVSKKY